MLIANPIYDVVFKYLMEDLEIARGLLSTILGVQITKLEVKPQETLVAEDSGEVRIFHLDFKALIELADGGQRTVLIELQKARKSFDILRFRKYLGKNYLKEELRYNAIGELEGYAVEIVTIYILGFQLEGVEVPVLKVNRKFVDAITELEVSAKNEFIEKLTHESYMIQIPRLKRTQRNQLEEVLEVFSQENVTDDLHTLQFETNSKNALVKKIAKRLSRAAANEKIKNIMDAEDSMNRILNREMQEQARKFEEKLRVQQEAAEEKLQQADEKLRVQQEAAEEKLQQADEKLRAQQEEIERLRLQLEGISRKPT